ncbi:arabinosyltransferase [Pseudonocardia sp. K10HN5]|uniref:Arabinosyltransferase n=2 Tax=Pseudonocardia acidicola TaxID=2724939 RepID=A0ABX1SKH1_9PSEU|nr:arabinosyltransferase domain-containing protein [Pseudonocardia acidicola]NMI01551.1 arabinosyltransferase [Pseudonocardia acidicola]
MAVLAPVNADDPVVTWPQAGAAPASTVLPLSPYRPLELRAEVPCTTLQALDRRPGGGEALRTLPASVDSTLGSGLVVAVSGGTVTVSSSGAGLVSQPLPAAPCSYVVEADAAGTRVTRDGAVLADRAGLLPPQVAELETGAEGLPEASGLSVRLHTDARYESSPSALKIGLLIAHGLALLALLALAWRTWRGSGPGLIRPRPSAADAAVVVVSAAWAVIGPVNVDDSWYALMSRNAEAAGYIGNYIYQFNVTENPFVASQYLMQAWGALGGWSLLWLRVLPVLYGLLTYTLLRVLLATTLGRIARRRSAPWALAVAHLLWFLAYGITLRPETLIVVGTAAVMLLAELARRRESIGVLAAATAVAALTMTVSPTALVAVVALVPALPFLWTWLRAADWPQRVAAALVAGGAATVVVPVGFGDASLGDVLESVAVHRWYYRQHPWYDEFVHYATLLDQADTGVWAKRLPVLLTLALLAVSLVALGRRRFDNGPIGRLLAGSALISGLALVSLAATPTKWVNHFGAVAAPATLLLAVALIRSPLPRRAGSAALVVAGMFAVGAAAVSYAGPNLWRPFSDWGQLFGNHADIASPYQLSLLSPHIGPLELRNPALWLVVAAAAAWWVNRRRRAGRPSGLTPDRAVVSVAAAGGIALMLIAFTLAPIRQAPGASVAGMNLATLEGNPCGLEDSVQVLGPAIGKARSLRLVADTDTRGPALGRPIGSDQLAGDMVTGTPPARSAPADAPNARMWHDDVPGGSGTGSLISGWYPLPAGLQGDAIVLPVTGDLLAGQEVALEFGTGTPGAPDRTVRIELGPDGKQADWVNRTVALSDVKLDRPTAVRVVVKDNLGGTDSWLGVAEPRLATARPAGDLIGDQPVFADQVSAVLWPCVNQIAIHNGIADAPAFRLRAGDGLEAAVGTNSTFAPNGGTLAGVDRTARYVELPSSLDPAGPPAALGWGHVEQVVYDHPVGRYDLTVGHVQRDGWARLPTLVGKAYTGRDYIG